ncbi:geobacillin-26 family protein [Clostridium sp.]|uniref:geobacillin-26 family protein n=1 Tax=Clostridium sp. TaxID=1506 RepID=UPI002906280B|nr:geobacillin-26 family protein [Clostridium sp.]MDU5106546.1 geobacillin-26 family protein [Clostridium sp.]
MKKNLKKIITGTLCGIMTTSLLQISALAETKQSSNAVEYDNSTYYVEESVDNSTNRVVTVKEGDSTVTAEFNKETGEMTVIENGIVLLSTNINNNIEVSTQEPYAMPRAALLDSETDFNGEYGFWRYAGGQWVLKVPTGGDVTYENSNNKEYLLGFASAVRDILSAQVTILSIAGGGTIATITALFAASGPTLGTSAVIALLGAAGVAVACTPAALNWYFAVKDANLNYKLA